MRWAPTMLLLTLALSGCGGLTPEESGDGGGEEPARDPVTWTIVIEGNDFVDGSLTIQAGDTVVWVHQDGGTPHTVTSDDGAFDSGTASEDHMTENRNSEFSHTFDETGAFPYHCAVHPGMTDTVTVEERFSGTP